VCVTHRQNVDYFDVCIRLCLFEIVILVFRYEQEKELGFFVVDQQKYKAFIRDKYYIILIL